MSDWQKDVREPFCDFLKEWDETGEFPVHTYRKWTRQAADYGMVDRLTEARRVNISTYNLKKKAGMV